MIWLGILLVIISNFFAAFGAYFFKRSAKRFSFNLKALITNKYLYLGILLYGISALFFIPALRLGELSTLYPFVSIGYIFTIILSVKLLGEKMNKFKWIAIIFVVIGVSLIGIGS